MGIGRAFVYEPFIPQVAEMLSEDAAKELEAYEAAKRQAKEELISVRAKLSASDEKKAGIFTAQISMLYDPAVESEVRKRIERDHACADWAIDRAYEKFAGVFENSGVEVIRERAADLRDVRLRLLRALRGVPEKSLSMIDEPVVLVARDLYPSDTIMLDVSKTLAIVTELGGSASHSAIIARNFSIPAVSGIKDVTAAIRQGQEVIVDAIEGFLIADPNESQLDEYKTKRDGCEEDSRNLKECLDLEPATADGVRMDIELNIGGPSDIDENSAKHSDGVGLFRTEFLYMGRKSLPSEEEQLEAYKSALEKLGELPVTLRTVDIGGDKTLDYWPLPKEANPFLGKRALRLCFDCPSVFKTQLRAALRASAFGNLWIMFPMVTGMEDIRKAKTILEETKAELEAEGISCKPVLAGVMIEVPSLALIADSVANEVDFASIGSNDLIQYTLAADRMNADVSGYYQMFHPAVFRLIGYAASQFAKASKPLAVCGEMGGNPLAAAALIGLGIRKLSMSASSIGPIKRMLGGITLERAKEMAHIAQTLQTAEEVEKRLQEILRA
jgi:phosphotransferase system enzyme I (PtsI)